MIPFAKLMNFVLNKISIVFYVQVKFLAMVNSSITINNNLQNTSKELHLIPLVKSN